MGCMSSISELGYREMASNNVETNRIVKLDDGNQDTRR